VHAYSKKGISSPIDFNLLQVCACLCCCLQQNRREPTARLHYAQAATQLPLQYQLAAAQLLQMWALHAALQAYELLSANTKDDSLQCPAAWSQQLLNCSHNKSSNREQLSNQDTSAHCMLGNCPLLRVQLCCKPTAHSSAHTFWSLTAHGLVPRFPAFFPANKQSPCFASQSAAAPASSPGYLHSYLQLM
jgi:hypothetical protein